MKFYFKNKFEFYFNKLSKNVKLRLLKIFGERFEERWRTGYCQSDFDIFQGWLLFGIKFWEDEL